MELGQEENRRGTQEGSPLIEDEGEVIPVHIFSADDEKGEASSIVSSEETGEKQDSHLEHLKRLQAEFVNFKRRTDRERAEFAAEGRRGLVRLMLPVLDDFDQFFSNHTNGHDEVVAGVQLINKKLRGILEDAGLRQFGQTGENFNPELHEAVLVAECDPEGDGRLLEVWQPGYTFDGKLLRPAKVKVGRARKIDGQM